MDMFWTGVSLCAVSVVILLASIAFWSSLYKEAYNLGFDTHRKFGHLHPRLRLVVNHPSEEEQFTVEGMLLDYDREKGRYTILEDDGNEYKVYAEFVKKAEMVSDYNTEYQGL